MTKPTTWSPSASAAVERLRDRLFASTTEAAAVLRDDARTIRKGIESGEIPSVKVGATYRIPAAWIREQAGLGMAQPGPDAA
jgi:excisionase family DNA binding protein